MRQVFLLGNDISDKVVSIPDVVTTAGDFGQLTVNDLPNITGDNQDGFWDNTNQGSPFYGAREISDYDIEIYNKSEKVYIGTIQGIQINNQDKTATVTLKSKIQRALEKGLVYASVENSNPATMIQEICSLYKIDCESASFGRANGVYELDNVRTSALFKNEGTVADGIQQILEIGIGRIYLQNNRLYYDVFREKETPVIFTASDKVDNTNGVTLFGHPNVTIIEKEPITGYNIKYIQGAAIFGDTENQGKSIDGSYASPVRIMTLQSAVWIGERWMDYFGKPQQIIDFSIASNYGKAMRITDPIGIEYRGRTFTTDITSINNSLQLESKLGGITR
jgi:hypothetical protein